MRKRVILEISKTKSKKGKDEYTTYIYPTTSPPSHGYISHSISLDSPESLGKSIYETLKDSPNLDTLDEIGYSEEVFQNYKLIHVDLLNLLLESYSSPTPRGNYKTDDKPREPQA